MRFQVDGIELALSVVNIRNSDKAAAEWLRSFVDTLLYVGKNSNRNGYAMKLIAEVDGYKASRELSKMRSYAAAEMRKYGKEVNQGSLDRFCAAKYKERYLSAKEASNAAKESNVVEPAAVQESSLPSSPVKDKDMYGEFGNVALSSVEYSKVLAMPNGQELIEELSSYMASRKTSYKSHYAVILNWSRRKSNEQKNRRTTAFCEAQNDMLAGANAILAQLKETK